MAALYATDRMWSSLSGGSNGVVEGLGRVGIGRPGPDFSLPKAIFVQTLENAAFTAEMFGIAAQYRRISCVWHPYCIPMHGARRAGC